MSVGTCHLGPSPRRLKSLGLASWLGLSICRTQKLGVSLATSQPIWPDLQRAMGHTLQIVIIGMLILVVQRIFRLRLVV